MRSEWGWEKRGEQALFEKLSLEGAQAGLSWATILAKREASRRGEGASTPDTPNAFKNAEQHFYSRNSAKTS